MDIVPFEKKNLEVINKLVEFEKQVKLMEEQRDEFKKQLEKSMIEYDILKFKTDKISITRVKPSIKTDISWKNLRKNNLMCMKNFLLIFLKSQNQLMLKN